MVSCGGVYRIDVIPGSGERSFHAAAFIGLTSFPAVASDRFMRRRLSD
jgi:hypothetical protein